MAPRSRERPTFAATLKWIKAHEFNYSDNKKVLSQNSVLAAGAFAHHLHGNRVPIPAGNATNFVKDYMNLPPVACIFVRACLSLKLNQLELFDNLGSLARSTSALPMSISLILIVSSKISRVGSHHRTYPVERTNHYFINRRWQLFNNLSI